jgi:hypothetical protein
MSIEDKLEIMESFVRVMPMPVRSEKMIFLCNCKHGYRDYVSAHAGILSMLWDPDQKFFNIEQAEQLKANLKETEKASNSFTAAAKRKKKPIDEAHQAKDYESMTRSRGILTFQNT